MKSILVRNGTVITMNPKREIIPDGTIMVEGGLITKIGPSPQFEGLSADMIIDATGQLIIPGLVNAHTHTAYFMMRGLGMDRILLDWLVDIVWPWLKEMDEVDVNIASKLGYVECLKSGTTCLIDNQNYPTNKTNNFGAAFEAAKECGLRVTFAFGFSDIRFICPQDFISTPLKIEESCRQQIKDFHQEGLVEVAISPINLLYCSDESIKRTIEIMREFGVCMHSHVAESKQELEAIKERFGQRGYIEAFQSLGALNDHFQAVHAVWISDKEIELIQEYGSHVIYNPTSNMLLASGVAPITKLQSAGVNVALGTDNPNNNNDMIEAMKFAGLLQKVSTFDPLATPAMNVLEMATLNGARALHKQKNIGSLEVGKQADIVTVDMRKPHNSPLLDPVATLVYSSNGGDVTNVIVAGNLLVEDGRVTFLDEQALISEVQERADRIVKKVTKVKR